MNKAMQETEEGRVRLEYQIEKENMVFARKLEKHDEEQAAPVVVSNESKVVDAQVAAS